MNCYSFFLGIGLPGRAPPTKKQAEHLNQIIEPVAKDGGSQLIVQVNGDVHIDRRVTISSRDANAVQNQIARYLAAKPPEDSTCRGEVLYLWQVRDDIKRRTVGDRGVIDRLSRKPVALQFATEAVKRVILDQAFPFRHAFIVDVDVRTVGGRPALYRILDVTDVIRRPDLDDDEASENDEPSA